MKKVFRILAMCAISVPLATWSMAWAQSYRTVDFPGATTTFLIGGPDPQGTSVGQEITAGVSHGFTLTAAGEFTAFDPPGSIFTVANFITSDGVILGQFQDASHVSHGFVLYKGQYTTFDVPGVHGTVLSSINPSGEMTGLTCPADPTCETPPYKSFTVSAHGVITSFNPFGAVSSFASAVNPSGTVVGIYTDSGGVTHGYQLYQGNFTSNDFPGSTFTFNGGINASGDIVGSYTDNSNVTHSFLLSHGVYTSFDPPGATLSEASGINPSGVIVGVYVDSANVIHGYIRTP